MQQPHPAASASPAAAPLHANWDLTYACQLRCLHCYSQSGRRPSRALPLEQQLLVARRLVDGGVRSVAFAGGEPLLLGEALWELAAYFRSQGVATRLYTNGWSLDAAAAEAVRRRCDRVHVSFDGPDAALHDRVRGRLGAFDAAVAALHRLDALGPAGAGLAPYGIDATVLRSGFDAAPRYAVLAARFDHLAFVQIGAVVPAGLASMPWFAEAELLTDRQMDQLADPQWADALRRAAPAGVDVAVHDSRDLRAGVAGMVQVEPDGAVRALAVNEGVVGNLLHEDFAAIAPRIAAWRHQPWVRAALSDAGGGMQAWAGATRRIDVRGADEAVRRLIAKRRPAVRPLSANEALPPVAHRLASVPRCRP